MLENNWQNRSSDSWIFSGADFTSPILVSPYICESTKILHGGDCSLWLVEICKIMCLIVCTPPSPKSRIYWPFPIASLEQFLRAIWGAVSQAVVLILPQIKLNSQLSHYAFAFKVDTLKQGTLLGHHSSIIFSRKPSLTSLFANIESHCSCQDSLSSLRFLLERWTWSNILCNFCIVDLLPLESKFCQVRDFICWLNAELSVPETMPGWMLGVW